MFGIHELREQVEELKKLLNFGYSHTVYRNSPRLRTIDSIEEQLQGIHNRLNFLEQRLDPQIIAMIKEWDELFPNEPMTHIAYDLFQVPIVSGPTCTMNAMTGEVTYTSHTNTTLTTNEVKQKITKKKLEKYEQCRKKRKC